MGMIQNAILGAAGSVGAAMGNIDQAKVAKTQLEESKIKRATDLHQAELEETISRYSMAEANHEMARTGIAAHDAKNALTEFDAMKKHRNEKGQFMSRDQIQEQREILRHDLNKSRHASARAQKQFLQVKAQQDSIRARIQLLKGVK